MEHGDLGTWEASSIVVVLEGVLCHPLSEGRLRRHLVPADQWEWSMVAGAWLDGQNIDAKGGLTLSLESLRQFLIAA